MNQGAPNFMIKDLGDQRAVMVDGKEYQTHLSARVLEKIIARKGADRVVPYIHQRHSRARIVDPLFSRLEAKGASNLRLLEVGCGAGLVTEHLHAKQIVGEIFTYDVDRFFVEIIQCFCQDQGLAKVKRADHFTSRQTRTLPYPDCFFDLVIVNAVVEHLPFEGRDQHVDEYYRVLKTGGHIGFFDTPNRHYPLESHSLGLPLVHRFSPQTAFIYAKFFGKLKGASFAEFTRAGTGWRNATYYDCLPHGIMADVLDVSEEAGYGFPFFRRASGRRYAPFYLTLRWLSRLLDFPFAFYQPKLNLVFQKTKDYESAPSKSERWKTEDGRSPPVLALDKT